MSEGKTELTRTRLQANTNMARIDSKLLQNLRGGVGKQLIFKQYGDKTVVTSYPDMSRVKPSEQQKKGRKLFAEAVAYARAINRNPEQKAAYAKKLKPGESVYRFALKEYLAQHKK